MTAWTNELKCSLYIHLNFHIIIHLRDHSVVVKILWFIHFNWFSTVFILFPFKASLSYCFCMAMEGKVHDFISTGKNIHSRLVTLIKFAQDRFFCNAVNVLPFSLYRDIYSWLWENDKSQATTTFRKVYLWVSKILHILKLGL